MPGRPWMATLHRGGSNPLTVKGARSSEEARRAARTVAASQLVQCSLYGQDPYWGRVLSELVDAEAPLAHDGSTNRLVERYRAARASR